MTFTHLHVHTDYSMLDGLGKIKDYVGRAVELRQPALAITDHGTVAGAYEHYTTCRKAGIEPVLGEEFYFVPDVAKHKEQKGAGERYHLTVLAKGAKGFEVLAELSTESHRNFYRYPLIDYSILGALGDDAKHLVILSGCAGSVVSQMILSGDKEGAYEEVKWWATQPWSYFIELMHHNTRDDRKLNKGLLAITNNIRVPWVVTNDPHYVHKEHEGHHDVLLAIQTASDVDDPDRFRFDGTGYHLKSRAEMKRAMARYAEDVWLNGARQTVRVAKLCKTRIPAWEGSTWHIPKFPDTDDPQAFLRRLTVRGLKERGLYNKPEYRRQAKEELDIIESVGIANFLLIVWDIMQFIEKAEIRVGPGRGSVAGSLVGYLIGLHRADPIKYKLLFGRFLNPERPKMPDIDTDIPPSRRPEVFQYAIDKYGQDNVKRLVGFQTMQVKSAFGGLCGAYGISFEERMRLSKLILEDEEGLVVLPEELQEGYPELAEQLEIFKGTKKAIARHPAGIVIFEDSDPIKNYVPERWLVTPKLMVAQFDLHTAEDMKLLKMDFLGLRTLETIDECVKMLHARYGFNDEHEPNNWVPDDEPGDDAVYKMLANGHVVGVFQMEGPTNARGIVEMQPTCLEDIVVTTSMYRLGPIEAGAPERYLKNRADNKLRVAHPVLKPLLADSWGEMIYEEQMFEILRQAAGFSWARVQDAKDAVKRKDPEKMAAIKSDAVKGFMKTSGMVRKTALLVWRMIEAQTAYLFNRSHAVVYSINTYQTARLKRYWPLEYLTACLRTIDASTEAGKAKRLSYLTEAMRLGFKVEPPDINLSDIHATCDGNGTWDDPGDGVIRLGLQDIKGIGPAAAAKLLKARNEEPIGFFSMEDVADAARNVGVVAALKDSGACASLGIRFDITKQSELVMWRFDDPMVKYRRKWDRKARLPGPKRKMIRFPCEIEEVEKRTTKAKGIPYVQWRVRWSQSEAWIVRIWQEAQSLWSIPRGSIVVVEGEWNQEWSSISINDPEAVRLLKRARPQRRSA